MSVIDSSKTAERKRFKDWFDEEAARALAGQIGAIDKRFSNKKFIELATSGLQDLEFAGRVGQFADALAACLPDDVPQALGILRDSLPAPLPDCDAVMDGWLQWPVGQFIANRGIEHFEESMLTMIELTRRFSSEFAVRPFVEHRQKETISYLRDLTDHESAHVRRWCSEGVRTRLPWGKKLHRLIADPKPVLPILDALKDDHEVYVRRSVANNLNDLSKDHPELVIAQCGKWYRQDKPQRITLVKQALRGLIKAGDPAALTVIGFAPPEKIQARLSVAAREITLGGTIELTAEITSRALKMQPLLIDYVVHFVRKNKKQGAKVFKWRTLDLGTGDTAIITKKHSFKASTVRALYPGTHFIEMQINGVLVASTAVELRA